MKYFSEDISQWPLHITKLNPIEPSEKEFDEYLSYLGSLLEKRERYADILLMSEGKYLPSNLRIKMGNWVKVNKENLLKYQACMAFVNESIIMNVVLKSIFIVSPPLSPYIVTSKFDEALNFAKKYATK